jgi:hypothetical protein
MGSKHSNDASGVADSGRAVKTVDLRKRRIVAAIFATTGVAALPQLWRGNFIANAAAPTPQLTRETLNAIAVFFAPGPDLFSLQQGEVTKEPGAIEAGAGEGLYHGLNFVNPMLPELADTIADIFNSTADAVNPGRPGPFESSFANLSFAQKGVVLAALESNAATAQWVGVLPLVVGFLTFAETAVFDPVTRTILGRPIGWDLGNYSGLSDGRGESHGYRRNRRKTDA